MSSENPPRVSGAQGFPLTGYPPPYQQAVNNQATGKTNVPIPKETKIFENFIGNIQICGTTSLQASYTNFCVPIPQIAMFRNNVWSCMRCSQTVRNSLVQNLQLNAAEEVHLQVKKLFTAAQDLMMSVTVDDAEKLASVLNSYTISGDRFRYRERNVIIRKDRQVMYVEPKNKQRCIQTLKESCVEQYFDKKCDMVVTQRTYFVYADVSSYDYKKSVGEKKWGVGLVTFFNSIPFPPDSVSNGEPSPTYAPASAYQPSSPAASCSMEKTLAS